MLSPGEEGLAERRRLGENGVMGEVNTGGIQPSRGRRAVVGAESRLFLRGGIPAWGVPGGLGAKAAFEGQDTSSMVVLTLSGRRGKARPWPGVLSARDDLGGKVGSILEECGGRR